VPALDDVYYRLFAFDDGVTMSCQLNREASWRVEVTLEATGRDDMADGFDSL
jgi:hypothetical protein